MRLFIAILSLCLSSAMFGQRFDLKYDLGGIFYRYHELALDLQVRDTSKYNIGIVMGYDYSDFKTLELDSNLVSSFRSFDFAIFYTELELSRLFWSHNGSRNGKIGFFSRWRKKIPGAELTENTNFEFDNNLLVGITIGFKIYLMKWNRIFTDIDLSYGRDILSDVKSDFTYVNWNIGYRF